jgi:hypothetical protein
VVGTLPEYLVSHGRGGGFGCFTSAGAVEYRRGDRVVVEGPHGLELGEVLCAASDRHARLLPAGASGKLLRGATDADRRAEAESLRRAAEMFEEGRGLLHDLGLPVTLLDAQLLLDAQHLVLQVLAPAGADLGPLAEPLARRHGVVVLFENLAGPAEAPDEHGGCGEPGCGRAAGGGGCSSCGSGGGCSSCGGKVDMRDYFAHLRTKMEESRHRTTLL